MYVASSLKASPASGSTFRQDNGPCHTAKMIKQFFEVGNVEVMAWHTQSPDFIPIENLWKIIHDNVKARRLTAITDLG